MNTIITFTLTQLVGLVLAICAAIAHLNSQRAVHASRSQQHWSDAGEVTAEYRADPTLFIQRKIADALS